MDEWIDDEKERRTTPFVPLYIRFQSAQPSSYETVKVACLDEGGRESTGDSLYEEQCGGSVQQVRPLVSAAWLPTPKQ